MGDTVRIGVFSPSSVIVLGTELGVFESAGIDLTVSRVVSSVSAFTALVNRDLDVLVTSPDNVLAYRLNTSNPLGGLVEVQVLAGVDLGLGLSLLEAPSARQDLGRLRLGVDAPRTGFAVAAYSLLVAVGRAAESYDIVELGTTPARREALVDGRCDVTMLNAGHDEAAEALGCKRLLRVSEQLGPYLGSVLAGLESWGDERGDRLRRLLDAWEQASRAVVDVAIGPELTARLQTMLVCDVVAAERAAETLRSRTEGLLLDGQIDLAALQTVIDLRAGQAGFDGDDSPTAAGAFDSGLVRRPG